VVAIIAQERLSPQASAAVRTLLQLEHKSDLSQIANWADQVNSRSSDGPRHTMRLPLDNSTSIPPRICSRKRECTTEAIEDEAAILRGGSSSELERLESLKYIVHLVGDIHQPLHMSADPGREDVIFRRRFVTLHKVWDTLIIRSFRKAPAELAALASVRASEGRLNLGGSPRNWALESRDIARDKILPGIQKFARDGDAIVLPADYAEESRAIVLDRLSQAGIRLANLLNDALGH